MADDILGHGADVLVEEPDDLRAVVIDRLRASVGAAR